MSYSDCDYSLGAATDSPPYSGLLSTPDYSGPVSPPYSLPSYSPPARYTGRHAGYSPSPSPLPVTPNYRAVLPAPASDQAPGAPMQPAAALMHHQPGYAHAYGLQQQQQPMPPVPPHLLVHPGAPQQPPHPWLHHSAGPPVLPGLQPQPHGAFGYRPPAMMGYAPYVHPSWQGYLQQQQLLSQQPPPPAQQLPQTQQDARAVPLGLGVHPSWADRMQAAALAQQQQQPAPATDRVPLYNSGLQQPLGVAGGQPQQQQQQQQPQQPPGAGPAAAGAAAAAGPAAAAPPPTRKMARKAAKAARAAAVAAAAAGTGMPPATGLRLRADADTAQGQQFDSLFSSGDRQQQQQQSMARAAAAAAAAGGAGGGGGQRQQQTQQAGTALRSPVSAQFMGARTPPGLGIAPTAPQQQKQQQEQQQPPPPPPAPASAAVAGSPAGASAAGTAKSRAEAYFRANAADTNPFWASATADPDGLLACAPLLPPPPAAAAANGQPPQQDTQVATCELVIVLDPLQLQQLQDKSARLQLWCYKVGDAVKTRNHWPQAGRRVRVNHSKVFPPMAKRLQPGGGLLPHQADLPVDITAHALACQPRLTLHLEAQLSSSSTSTQEQQQDGFVLACRLVRQRSVQEVKAMLAPPPSLQQAVQQLRDKMAGDDDDIVAGTTSVSTRCAASTLPLETPCNFGAGEGLVCFDLDCYLQMAQQSQKWQCPGTRNFHTWRELQESPWMAAVLSSLKAAGLKQSVSVVEVAPDAKWRPQGAVSWFDVLDPPTPQQLKASLQQQQQQQSRGADAAAAGGGAGGSAKRAAAGGAALADDSGGGAAAGGEEQEGPGPAKRRRQEAAAAPDVIHIDLLDSDDDEGEGDKQVPSPPLPPPAAASPAAAAAAASPGTGMNAEQRPIRRIKVIMPGSAPRQQQQDQQQQQAAAEQEEEALTPSSRPQPSRPQPTLQQPRRGPRVMRPSFTAMLQADSDSQGAAAAQQQQCEQYDPELDSGVVDSSSAWGNSSAAVLAAQAGGGPRPGQEAAAAAAAAARYRALVTSATAAAAASATATARAAATAAAACNEHGLPPWGSMRHGSMLWDGGAQQGGGGLRAAQGLQPAGGAGAGVRGGVSGRTGGRKPWQALHEMWRDLEEEEEEEVGDDEDEEDEDREAAYFYAGGDGHDDDEEEEDEEEEVGRPWQLSHKQYLQHLQLNRQAAAPAVAPPPPAAAAGPRVVEVIELLSDSE